MVKPLTFKGDKKPKKRKRTADDPSAPSSLSKQDVPEDALPDDDSWVSADTAGDVVGPVMIVLPTAPPSALACDVSGKVFCLAVENIVDGNPGSAEPHDVRMVWVANRIAGTGNFRFKGHHGRYLACDKIGLLSATSEAISPLETWSLITTGDPPSTRFQMQAHRETFLTAKSSTSTSTSTSSSSKANKPPEIRGDADPSDPSTTVRIRMQARFKPHLKSSREKDAQAKISRRELEDAAGRRLDEEEVRKLKRARRQGDYHERLLEIKVKSKHDKFG